MVENYSAQAVELLAVFRANVIMVLGKQPSFLCLSLPHTSLPDDVIGLCEIVATFQINSSP